MPHIFISYSRKDEAFAHRLAQSLSDLGADIWIDVKAISAGTKWSRAIQQGLDTCDALIVVVSPDSMASTNVEDEWQYYLEQKKPVIPVLIRPAKMHFQLNRIQYVDFHRQPYDGGLRQLHAELRRNGLKLNAPPVATEAQAAAPGMSGRGRAGLVVGAVAVIALLLVGAVLLSQGGGAGTPTDVPTPAASSTVLSVAQPPTSTPAPTDTDVPVEPTATDTDVPIEPTSTAFEAVATESAADLPTAEALLPHPIVCDGAPPSRLNVGMAARVTLSEVGALSRAQNVRPAPGTDSEPRVPVPEGTEFDIIGGPECVDGFVWWFIETTSAPFVTGWTAEGGITPAGGSDYFLEARE